MQPLERPCNDLSYFLEKENVNYLEKENENYLSIDDLGAGQGWSYV